MKAGYITLFGAVLAFSAYQGAKPSSSSNTKNSTLASRVEAKNKPPKGVEALPSISAGECNRPIDDATVYPCDGCGPICPAADLHDLIQEHFQAELGGPEKQEVAQAKWGVPAAQAKNIDYVIASLADPVHTNMALFFDREIETIEKAAQVQGYFFSRSWMPWDISAHPEPTDFTVRMAQSEVQSQREKLPGLMIFRKPPRWADVCSTDVTPSVPQGQTGNGSPSTKPQLCPAKTLLVFVVGETPTGGIHAEQFQNALHIRKSIESSSSDTKDHRSPLLIFGPTFSGSLPSLSSILKGYRNKFSKISIRSGTVSSFRSTLTFCKTARADWPEDEQSHSVPDDRPDFATLQFSDEYEEFYLSAFFADRHQLHSHVAILSEDETQYGNLERSSRVSAEGEGNPNLASSRAGDCLDEPPQPLLPLIHLYFPREIAQLRSAYEQNLKLQPPANPENYVPPQTRLPLTLGVTGNDDDSVPAFAPSQTPLSQDAVMQAIVSTLRNQHAKVVIIRASDPLDMVFLARYLRQNYPQARLVTSGADLLMVYDVADPRFHGILAVTSYPLLNGAEFPTYGITESTQQKSNDIFGSSVQRIFSDNFSVGSFNAFLSLLASGNQKQPPQSLPPADYAQFGRPSFLSNNSPGRPHLWLTTVGRDGFWPVSVLDDVSVEHINKLALEIAKKLHRTQRPPIAKPAPTVPEGPLRSELPHAFSVHFTVGWSIFWVITIGLTFGLSYLLFLPPDTARSEVLARFSTSGSAERNRLLIVAASLLLLTQTLFAFPAMVWLKRFGGNIELSNLPEFNVQGILLLMLACLAPALALYVVFGKCFPKLKRAQKLRLLLLIGLLGILIWLFEEIWLVWFCYVFSLFILPIACGELLKQIPTANRVIVGGVTAALAIGLPATLLCLTWWFSWAAGDSEFQSFVFRYIQTGSGVSPLLPFFFILVAWIWWCWQSLTGVASAQEKRIKLPLPADFTSLAVPAKRCDANGTYDRARLQGVSENTIWTSGVLNAVPLRVWHIPIFSLIGFLGICALMNPSEIAEAFESIWYRRLYWYFMLYPCLLLICFLAAHIVVLWLQLRDLLRSVERVPFRRGFADVKNLTWKPLWKLAGAGRGDFLKVFNQELAMLRRIQNLGVPDVEFKASIERVMCQTDEVSSAYERQLTHSESRTQFVALQIKTQEQFVVLQKDMSYAATRALIFANAKWTREPYVPTDSDSTKNEDNKSGPSEPPAANLTLRAVEHFLCLFYLNVILVPLRRLQTLILALAGVFVFVLLSYSSYPFESRESFHALLISILFAISLVVGIVYGQMYSDPLLSRITNTKPGELGLDFWVKLGTFVFIPVLSLLSVQFPEVNSFLFSWLQPALQSIK